MKIESRKYNLFFFMKAAFVCAPFAALFMVLRIMLLGLLPTIQIIVTAGFIDTALSIIADGSEVSSIFLPITYLVLLIAFRWTFSELNKIALVKVVNGAREKFRTAVTAKRAKLEYKHIENHDVWDLISRVSEYPEYRVLYGFFNILLVLSIFLRTAGIISLLIAEVWWAAVVIAAISMPLFILASKSGKANYNAKKEVSKHKRKYEYLTEVLTRRETVNERALFGYTGEINKVWLENYETARKKELKTQIQWFVKSKSGSFVTAVISILIIFILLNPVISGVITVGMYISLVTAVFSMVEMMSWNLTYHFDQIAWYKEYLKDLSAFSFLSESSTGDTVPDMPYPSFESLEFIDVRFKYPGTDIYVLNGLSFKMEKGRHYAFVGVNGAGKTTIAKILTGLYDEFEGDILLNGRSITDYTKAQLKAFFAVVYQDFAKYYISLKDNIEIGNVDMQGNPEAEKRFAEIISELDLEDTINKLPLKENTPLGKIKKGGADISGGQWQRVAMARAVFCGAPFRILDEPTASLDPISESRLYGKFEHISKNMTTLFISHRLGSTKLADIIFVLDSGKITEVGTHDELMELQGAYFEMYDSQRSWYQ